MAWTLLHNSKNSIATIDWIFSIFKLKTDNNNNNKALTNIGLKIKQLNDHEKVLKTLLPGPKKEY